MGNTISYIHHKEIEPSHNVDRNHFLQQIVVLKPILKEKLSNLPNAWNPAFHEFQFGENPQTINSKLPIQFSFLNWEDMPQADDFEHEIVKYFWLKLSQFGDAITKFIPPNTTVNDKSYICFLFVQQKLFNISIRLFYDDTHRNYDEIIEAYAKAVNTPVIESEQGKEFYYEDNHIIYYSYFHSIKNRLIIELLRKDQITLNDQTYPHLFAHRQRQKLSIQPFLLSSSHQYDIMISYCHKDKEFCHRLYYRLLQSQFRVCIDLESMYGPIVEQMAEAIENSEFVLICMSNAYKSSTYCQLEAEYAFKFQATLIPLVVKKDFTQTGWLGMLCGLRFQIDFTKTTFDEAYENLCMDIQRYRRQSTEKIQSTILSE